MARKKKSKANFAQAAEEQSTEPAVDSPPLSDDEQATDDALPEPQQLPADDEASPAAVEQQEEQTLDIPTTSAPEELQEEPVELEEEELPPAVPSLAVDEPALEEDPAPQSPVGESITDIGASELPPKPVELEAGEEQGMERSTSVASEGGDFEDVVLGGGGALVAEVSTPIQPSTDAPPEPASTAVAVGDKPQPAPPVDEQDQAAPLPSPLIGSNSLSNGWAILIHYLHVPESRREATRTKAEPILIAEVNLARSYAATRRIARAVTEIKHDAVRSTHSQI